MTAEANRIKCFHCKHFYITWDEFFPRGCKALKFKSREMPSGTVLRSSGIECQMFEKAKRSTRNNEPE